MFKILVALKVLPKINQYFPIDLDHDRDNYIKTRKIIIWEMFNFVVLKNLNVHENIFIIDFMYVMLQAKTAGDSAIYGIFFLKKSDKINITAS